MHGLVGCAGEDGQLECFDPRQRTSAGVLNAAAACNAHGAWSWDGVCVGSCRVLLLCAGQRCCSAAGPLLLLLWQQLARIRTQASTFELHMVWPGRNNNWQLCAALQLKQLSGTLRNAAIFVPVGVLQARS